MSQIKFLSKNKIFSKIVLNIKIFVQKSKFLSKIEMLPFFVARSVALVMLRFWAETNYVEKFQEKG